MNLIGTLNLYIRPPCIVSMPRQSTQLTLPHIRKNRKCMEGDQRNRSHLKDASPFNLKASHSKLVSQGCFGFLTPGKFGACIYISSVSVLSKYRFGLEEFLICKNVSVKIASLAYHSMLRI
jgi:hypothetical protein